MTVARRVEAAPSPSIRIDQWLLVELKLASRSAAQKLLREGAVQVNGRSVKASHLMRLGDQVKVVLPEAGHVGVEPESVPLEVIYTDDDLVVVNKQPGVVVHPGAGSNKGTLVAGLLHRFGSLASPGGPLRPGIVHRLDRGTSGVMVVARSERAYYDLIRQFRDREIQKEYWALVWGTMRGRGALDAPIGRHPTRRTVMSVSAAGHGRPAQTEWGVIDSSDSFSLVRLKPRTGRTHQIRVHLSYLKHPIVGDPVYGTRVAGGLSRKLEAGHPVLRVDRPLLHARRLSFRHPASAEGLTFEAPVPEDFSRVVEAVGLKSL